MAFKDVTNVNEMDEVKRIIKRNSCLGKHPQPYYTYQILLAPFV